MRSILLSLLVAAVVSEECCDPKHLGLTSSQDMIKLCIEHGGIPVSEPFIDDGGHTFMILKQCALPGCQSLSVEKK